jgi:hypothetical protein
MHPAEWPLSAFRQPRFQPFIFARGYPETLPERGYEGFSIRSEF